MWCGKASPEIDIMFNNKYLNNKKYELVMVFAARKLSLIISENIQYSRTIPKKTMDVISLTRTKNYRVYRDKYELHVDSAQAIIFTLAARAALAKDLNNNVL